MKRPWHIWLAFGLAAAVAFGAMGWVTLTAARLDRAEGDARRQAELEENVRLALWRMDSTLAPLLAQENARPYFFYNAFYAADRAYTRMFAEIVRGEVLMPSPLLSLPPAPILLHFQLGPDGDLTSPQVPTMNMRDLAESGYTTPEKIEAAAARLSQLKARLGRAAFALAPSKAKRDPAVPARLPGPPPGKGSPPPSQVARNSVEWQARFRSFQQAASQEWSASNTLPAPPDVGEGVMEPMWIKCGKEPPPEGGTPSSLPKAIHEWHLREGIPRSPRTAVEEERPPKGGTPSEDCLVLARRVTVGGKEYIQGCWLDWPAIQDLLLTEIRDLLPQATLRPGAPDPGERFSRSLAALPVRLVPGAVPAAASPWATPVRLALLAAWGCVAMALAAVAALLVGAVALSERRAAFVSAVTHELRTPLTTFRMYTEMLAEGMVPDEAKRRSYLATLRSEAERLGHLIENVLAYARLERGRPGGRVEGVTLGALVERCQERLARRAEQAGMRLVLDAAEADLAATVRADPAAVEQILLNLVDNACKYAATAEDRRIHLEIGGEAAGRATGGTCGTRGTGGTDEPAGSHPSHGSHRSHRSHSSSSAPAQMLLRVRDHGPGIAASDARRLFRPFSKSARDAANSAPGVGLGLALSRRLARAMGGSLDLDRNVSDGACFVLALREERGLILGGRSSG